MNVFTFADREIKELKAEIERSYDFRWYARQSMDFENLPWEVYVDDHKGPSKAVLRQKLEEVHDVYDKFIDTICIVIPEDHWHAPGIWGWHLANQMHDYEVIIIKDRDRYFDTGEHEFYHTFDDIIYKYMGLRLEDILDVEDFDKDVVHGRDPRYEEYRWDDVATIIRPYLQKALAIKHSNISKASMRSVLIGVRKMLLSMQNNMRYIESNSDFSSQDQELMAKTIYGEARGESDRGKSAVGHVVYNRYCDRRWPDSISEVVKQPYQFSVWNPETVSGVTENENYKAVKNVSEDDETYKVCQNISRDILSGESDDPTEGACHYHATDIHPQWAKELKQEGAKTKKIGNHVFYIE